MKISKLKHASYGSLKKKKTTYEKLNDEKYNCKL